MSDLDVYIKVPSRWDAPSGYPEAIRAGTNLEKLQDIQVNRPGSERYCLKFHIAGIACVYLNHVIQKAKVVARGFCRFPQLIGL
jgi:hypothetical protein